MELVPVITGQFHLNGLNINELVAILLNGSQPVITVTEGRVLPYRHCIPGEEDEEEEDEEDEEEEDEGLGEGVKEGEKGEEES